MRSLGSRLIVFAVLAICFGFTGCVSPSNQARPNNSASAKNGNNANQSDEWFRPFTNIPKAFNKNAVELRYWNVSAGSRAKAIGLLKAKAFVNISTEEADAYSGGVCEASKGRMYILTRALFIGDEKNGFYVCQYYDGILVVSFISRDTKPGSMEKSALIVEVSELPREVFIEGFATE